MNVIRTVAATALVLGGLLIGAAPAGATTIIDFGSAAWMGANGHTSYAVGAVTARALPPEIAPNLTQGSSGLGISSFLGLISPDEINQLEVMKIDFAGGTHLNSFVVSKLFADELPGRNESGFYSIDGGANWTKFTQVTGNTNGVLNVGVNADVSSLLFGFTPYGSLAFFDTFDDFSVKSLSVTGGRADTEAPVPEPASLVLLGSGMLTLAARARSRRRKQDA